MAFITRQNVHGIPSQPVLSVWNAWHVRWLMWPASRSHTDGFGTTART